MKLVAAVIFCSTFVQAWERDPRCKVHNESIALRRQLDDNFSKREEESNVNNQDWDLYPLEHERSDNDKQSSQALDMSHGIDSGNSSVDPFDKNLGRQLVDTFDFLIKMYWKEGYCWQEEWRERKWCMACGTGEWGKDVEECNEGNVLILRRCNQADSLQRFVWEPIFGTGGGKLKPKSREDLCLTPDVDDSMKWYGSDRYKFKKCDRNNKSTQIMTGWKPRDRFELFPLGEPQRCFTQEHHPKPYEELFPGLCKTSRADKTSYWELYSTVGTPPDILSSSNTNASCTPYDLYLAQNEFIRNGQPVHDSEYDFHLEQENNGNLLVRRGNKAIWESGVKEEIGDYFTELQGDGNMITYNGTFGGDHNVAIWKTASSSANMTFYLGVDCVDNETVSIYQGAPNHSENAVWHGDPLPQKVPSGRNLTIPFDASSLDYSNYTKSATARFGTCAPDLPVDAKFIEDQVCFERFSNCAVGWTAIGDMLEYTFEALSNVVADITLRLASGSPNTSLYIQIEGIYGFQVAKPPGTGFDVYEDVVVWNGVSLIAGIHRMKVYFTTGQINFCSVSVTESSASAVPTVPFSVGALDYTDYLKSKSEWFGNCGPSGLVDAKFIDDTVCAERGSPCAISWTEPGDMIEYTFVASSPLMADISVRMASEISNRTFYIEIEGISGFRAANGPGRGWNAFEDVVVWSGVYLLPGSYQMRVHLTSGGINVCSVSVTESSASTALILPVDFGALDYSNLVRNSTQTLGNCGPGFVGAKFVDDAVCQERGGQCAIGWTEPGEMVEYTFVASSPLIVDISVRVASDSIYRTLRIEIEGISGFRDANGPGKGWNSFEDVVIWTGVPLPAGSHRMKVYFVSGRMNVCSFSMTEGMSPALPTFPSN